MTSMRAARRAHRRTRDHRAEQPLERLRAWARQTYKKADRGTLSPKLAALLDVRG